jgi:hypothetical protein
VSEYRDKLKSLSFGTKRGQSERKRIVDERDGSTAGTQTEHWDGSQDATAIAKPIHVPVQRLTFEEDR